MEKRPPFCKESVVSACSDRCPLGQTLSPAQRVAWGRAGMWGSRRAVLGALEWDALALITFLWFSGFCGCPNKKSRRHDEPYELGVRHSRKKRGKRGRADTRAAGGLLAAGLSPAAGIRCCPSEVLRSK